MQKKNKCDGALVFQLKGRHAFSHTANCKQKTSRQWLNELEGCDSLTPRVSHRPPPPSLGFVRSPIFLPTPWCSDMPFITRSLLMDVYLLSASPSPFQLHDCLHHVKTTKAEPALY
uniref:Uncharacterized protein n=1 Tax=Cucumis melo TaxID=3656 RepID=A0A9I9E7C7_CUCME